MAFFLAGSPAQLEDSLADLTSLLAEGVEVPGAAAAFEAEREPAAGVPAGLCKVPLVAALASTLGSSFFAVSTFFGRAHHRADRFCFGHGFAAAVVQIQGASRFIV